MIEFNKVSNESYFIKNLLYSTFLPLIRTVRENDYIIRDRLYIYKCNIIRCTGSGYIVAKNTNLNPDDYPENLLRKTDDEKVKIGQIYYSVVGHNITKIVGKIGDSRSPITEGWFEQNIATYKVIGEYYFGQRNGKLCRNFLSSSEGYDYKTHEKLGQYLRSLRDMYGLNLLPLYNCFSNQLLKNIHINNTSIERTSKNYSTKVYKVPIRFNTDYTICMNNIGMTTFAPAFIHHGTLLKLNNNRFGNNVDATNKYIKLNHNDVIHNCPDLRFKNPIKLRFDNVPKNKVIHYSEVTYTEIPAKYMSEYYRLNSAASPAYIKKETDYSYRSIDYNNPSMEGHKNYMHGYEYVIGEFDSGLTPSASLKPNDNLILPAGGFKVDVNITEEIFNQNKAYYFVYDPSTFKFTQCTEEDEFDSDTRYFYRSEVYESLNPSIGTFDTVSKSYKKCPEDETLFSENIFNKNKTKYYTFDTTTYRFIQCTQSSVYSENEIYYYVDKEKYEGWYEFIDNEFVKTQDTYINTTFYKCSSDFNEEEYNKNKTKYYTYDDLNDEYTQCKNEDEFSNNVEYYYKDTKKYYKKDMTEVPMTYNYDITEDNCCMYDYIEDELYLLIQVPNSFNSNIVILEGDYTDFSKENYYNEGKFELFSNTKLDHLFTDNLILMETNTEKLRPISPTLIQFLLWNAICNLDSINNDMDRLHIALSGITTLVTSYEYNYNYWTDDYRREVFNYAKNFPKKYIRDNLGYVTKDIERIIYQGDDFIESPDETDVPENFEE